MRYLSVALLLILAMTTTLQAQGPNTNWAGNVSSDWFDEDNWSNGVPGPGSRVTIGWLAEDKYQPVIDGETSMDRLTLGSNGNTLTIKSGSIVHVAGNLTTGHPSSFISEDITLTVGGDLTFRGEATLGGTSDNGGNSDNGNAPNNGGAYDIGGKMTIGNNQDVVVNGGILHIHGASSTGGNLSLKNGAEMHLHAGYTIGGSSNLTAHDASIFFYDTFRMNSGSFMADNSTAEFRGQSDFLGDGQVAITNGTFRFLDETSISGSAIINTGTGNLNFDHNLELSGSGTLHGEEGHITMNGPVLALQGNPTFNPGTSTFTFSGTHQGTPQQINETGNIPGVVFHNLEILNNSHVQSAIDVMVLNDMTVDPEAAFLPDAGNTLNVVGAVSGDPFIAAEKPYLISISPLSANSILLVFDDPLETASAGKPSNYRIEGQPDPTAVSPDSDNPNEVTLTLGFSMEEDTHYHLVANNIRNTSGESISHNHRKRFGLHLGGGLPVDLEDAREILAGAEEVLQNYLDAGGEETDQLYATLQDAVTELQTAIEEEPADAETVGQAIALVNDAVSDVIQALDAAPVVNTTRETSYLRIQAAIDHAREGDLIEVAPGNYPENVHIEGKNNLRLRGATDENGDPASKITGQNGHGIRVLDAENVTIENFDIDQVPGRGMYATTADGILIDNIRSRNNGNDGIRVRNAVDATIRHSLSENNNGDGITFYAYGEVLNNQVHNNTERGIYHVGSAAPGTGHVTISGNQVSGNQMAHSAITRHAAGIEVYAGSSGTHTLSATVENNVVGSGKGNGIMLYKVNHITGEGMADTGNQSVVRNNHISGRQATDHTQGDGILLYKSHQVLVKDNTTHDNPNAGIRVSGTYAGYGTYPTTNNTLAGNITNGNRYGVLIEKGAGDTRVSDKNQLMANTAYGLLNTSGEQVDATLNYWGDENGPYHADLNPGGQGNKVSDKVMFDPYYVNEGMNQLSGEASQELIAEANQAIEAAQEAMEEYLSLGGQTDDPVYAGVGKAIDDLQDVLGTDPITEEQLLEAINELTNEHKTLNEAIDSLYVPSALVLGETLPSEARAGLPLEPAVEVTVLNAAGQPLEGVTVKARTDQYEFCPQCNQAATSDAGGLAVLDNLILLVAAGDYNIHFTVDKGDGETLTSESFKLTVQPGPPVAAEIEGPTAHRPGATSGQYTLWITDAYGNRTETEQRMNFRLESENSLDLQFIPGETITVQRNGGNTHFRFIDRDATAGFRVIRATYQPEKTAGHENFTLRNTGQVSAEHRVEITNEWVWTARGSKSPHANWNDPANWNLEEGVPGEGAVVIIRDYHADVPPRLDNSSPLTIHTLKREGTLPVVIGAGSALTVEHIHGESQKSLAPLVHIESSPTGTGSFIHHEPGVHALVERHISGDSWAWHQLSAPVKQQELTGGENGFITRASFFAWHEPAQRWVAHNSTRHFPTWNDANNSTNDLLSMQGYLVAYRENPTKVFEGELHYGEQVVTLSRKADPDNRYVGFNMVGNPYAAAIDWKSDEWQGRDQLDSPVVWVWNDEEGQYGSYHAASKSDMGSSGASRYIAPMQGFWVRAAEDGQQLRTANAARTHSDQSWLKTALKEESGILRFQVQGDGNRYRDEVVMEFGHHQGDAGATKMFSMLEEAPSLYAWQDEQALSIAFFGEAAATRAVSLRFRAGVDGNYDIRVEGSSDFDYLVLEDTRNGTLHDLTTGDPYSFYASTSDDPGRFVVHVAKDQPTDTSEPGSAQDALQVYTHEHTLYINTTGPETSIALYDLQGRNLLQRDLHGAGRHNMPLSLPAGVYIVHARNGKQVVNERVVIR